MKEQLSVASGQSSVEDEIQNPKSKIQNGSPLPNSRKIYVEVGDLRVPFREISLTPSKAMDGSIEENAPVRVYDTGGPWTDPEQKHDVRDGLPPLRRDWIVARGDVEEYVGREVVPQDNGYLTKGAEDIARVKDRGALEEFPGLRRAPLRAKPGACVTQMHYARKGIITPEMEYVAIRENLGRRIALQSVRQLSDSDRTTTPSAEAAATPPKQ
jgi:phosphomethylpyrimidine synthase